MQIQQNMQSVPQSISFWSEFAVFVSLLLVLLRLHRHIERDVFDNFHDGSTRNREGKGP